MFVFRPSLITEYIILFMYRCFKKLPSKKYDCRGTSEIESYVSLCSAVVVHSYVHIRKDKCQFNSVKCKVIVAILHYEALIDTVLVTHPHSDVLFLKKKKPFTFYVTMHRIVFPPFYIFCMQF